MNENTNIYNELVFENAVDNISYKNNRAEGFSMLRMALYVNQYNIETYVIHLNRD